jgi:hypothetical protein
MGGLSCRDNPGIPKNGLEGTASGPLTRQRKMTNV